METIKKIINWSSSNKEKVEYQDYKELKENRIILIHKRGDRVTADNGISAIYEGPGIFDVYSRIVELYENTYDKVWWVVKTENPNITLEALERAGAKGKLYVGKVGLAVAKFEMDKISQHTFY